MRLFLGGVVLWCICSPACGGWLNDLVSPRGWNLGDGLVVHVNDSRHPNATFLERHSIMMDYGGYGVSVRKLPERPACELGLYTSDDGEARTHKNPEFAMVLGFKSITIAAIAFAVVAALVLKALIAAKVAAVTTMILLVSKLFQHHGKSHGVPHYVEVESAQELLADHSEIHPEYYQPTASGNYYSYANLPQGIDYAGAAVQTSATNSTLPATLSNQQVARRREGVKRKRVPLLTIHQYSLKR